MCMLYSYTDDKDLLETKAERGTRKTPIVVSKSPQAVGSKIGRLAQAEI